MPNTNVFFSLTLNVQYNYLLKKKFFFNYKNTIEFLIPSFTPINKTLENSYLNNLEIFLFKNIHLSFFFKNKSKYTLILSSLILYLLSGTIPTMQHKKLTKESNISLLTCKLTRNSCFIFFEKLIFFSTTQSPMFHGFYFSPVDFLTKKSYLQIKYFDFLNFFEVFEIFKKNLNLSNFFNNLGILYINLYFNKKFLLHKKNKNIFFLFLSTLRQNQLPCFV